MKKRVRDGVLIFNNIKLEKLINPKKIKILKMLQKEKKLTQTDVKNNLKLSYRQSKRYVDSLSKVGIIKKKKIKKQRGYPVYLSLK